jgi:hypothetical protein
MPFTWPKPPGQPEERKPEPEPEPIAPDDLVGERLRAFVELGFDDLSALKLAWQGVSPADVRERFLRRGCSHAEALRILI